MINRLDVYIHDYLVKRDLKASAQAFQAEGKVSSDPVGKISLYVHNGNHDLTLLKVHIFGSFSHLNIGLAISAIDAPGGFLFEWWSVFWDIFIARTNEKHSEVAASYIEVGRNLMFLISLSALVFFMPHFIESKF